jgi:hypothetical protein
MTGDEPILCDPLLIERGQVLLHLFRTMIAGSIPNQRQLFVGVKAL